MLTLGQKQGFLLKAVNSKYRRKMMVWPRGNRKWIEPMWTEVNNVFCMQGFLYKKIAKARQVKRSQRRWVNMEWVDGKELECKTSECFSLVERRSDISPGKMISVWARANGSKVPGTVLEGVTVGLLQQSPIEPDRYWWNNFFFFFFKFSNTIHVFCIKSRGGSVSQPLFSFTLNISALVIPCHFLWNRHEVGIWSFKLTVFSMVTSTYIQTYKTTRFKIA